MSDYARGDTVSLSRAQASLLEVVTPPVGVEAFTVDLPINEAPKAFTFTSVGGETVEEVAEGLLTVLLNDQTVYSVALAPSGYEIMIVGPLGEAFDATVTPNLTVAVTEEAVLGEPAGDLRVLAAESVSGFPPREFATRDRLGNLVELNVLSVRELGTGNVFEVDATKVLTVIDRVAG